jgi:pyridoxal phosphate-dependent aminotransferase EpsN
MSRIYLSAPDVRTAEQEMVNEAMASNWIAPVGPDLDAFEAEVAALAGRTHAVGMASGTAALHLALQEVGVGRGDTVVISTLTFAAPAFAAAYLGATPIFVDSERSTWQISPDLLEEELAARADDRHPPKAVVVVDVYGQCADYDRILAVTERYGVPLVEDAAEALGATYRGSPAGSFGGFSVLSFNGNKIVTTGGGGMLLCGDEAAARRVRYLSTQAREPLPHYEHREIGHNYRLSNLLAAFGRGQLVTLAERIERRRVINRRYRESLGALPGVSFMPVADYGEPNYWLTCITVDPVVTGTDRERVRQHLEADDIESRPTWKPMHLQPVFAANPRRVDGTAEDLFEHGLCLPSGSGMDDQQLDRVITALQEGLSGAG